MFVVEAQVSDLVFDQAAVPYKETYAETLSLVGLMVSGLNRHSLEEAPLKVSGRSSQLEVHRETSTPAVEVPFDCCTDLVPESVTSMLAVV